LIIFHPGGGDAGEDPTVKSFIIFIIGKLIIFWYKLMHHGAASRHQFFNFLNTNKD